MARAMNYGHLGRAWLLHPGTHSTCLSALDGAADIPPQMGSGAQEATPLSSKLFAGEESFFPAVLPLISCPCFSSLPPCSCKHLQLNSVSPKKKEKVEEKLAGGKGGPAREEDRVMGSENEQDTLYTYTV